ncbi:MAG: hypothetical protein ACYCVB_04575 [Bacilli bacterium]
MKNLRMMAATSVLASSVFCMAGVTSAGAASLTWMTTHVYMGSHLISSAPHVVALDPWSGQDTSYMAVSSLRTMLSSFHIRSQWNGVTLTLTAPSGWLVSAAGAPQPVPVYRNGNEMAIVLGAGGQFGRFPKLMIHGTTYAPVYYINQVLVSRFLMTGNWQGETWTLKSQK